MAHAPSQHAHASALRPAHRLAVAAGVIVPCLVLAGWTFGVATLKNVLPGQPDMVPNTALAFILTSASLWLLRSEDATRRAHIFALLCPCPAGLAGLLTLAEYVSGLDLRIDTLLFGASLREAADASFPGRPSPPTALRFLLLGSAPPLLSSCPCRR